MMSMIWTNPRSGALGLFKFLNKNVEKQCESIALSNSKYIGKESFEKQSMKNRSNFICKQCLFILSRPLLNYKKLKIARIDNSCRG